MRLSKRSIPVFVGRLVGRTAVLLAALLAVLLAVLLAEPLAAQKISGQVVQPDGKPVAGARLEWIADTKLKRWFVHKVRVAEPIVGKTGADGRFALDADAMVPLVGYSLFVVTDEFADHRTADLVRPEANLDLGKIQLQPGAEITGVVVDDNQKPLAGAVVRWFPAPGWADALAHAPARFFGWTATTDERGGYRLANVPPGRGTVQASKPDFTVDARHAVARSEAVWNERLTLFPKPSRRGIVSDEKGRPIAGAHVVMMVNNALFTTPSALARTNKDGEYAVCVPDNPGLMPVVLVPGHFGTSGGAPVEQLRLDYTVSAVPMVSVRVKTPAGELLQRFAARLVDQVGQPGNEFTMVEARDDGFAEIPAQASGSLMVEVRVPGYAPSLSAPAFFNHGQREVPPIDVVVATGRAIRGRVVDAAGKPVADARVTLYSGTLARMQRLSARDFDWFGSENRIPLRTDTEGRFAVENLRPQNYLVVVRCPGFARAMARKKLLANQDLDVGGIALQVPVRVTGTLTVRGKPGDGIRIVLRNEKTQEEFFTYTDRTGGFRFEQPIDPGPYFAIAVGPPGDKSFDASQNFKRVTIPAGKKAYLLQFKLK